MYEQDWYGNKELGRSDFSPNGQYDPYKYTKKPDDGYSERNSFTSYDPTQWGGVGAGWDADQQKWRQDQSGRAVAVDRYRALAGQERDAVKLNQAQAEAGRNNQIYGMQLAQTAAEGSAPSAAETYGGRMIDDSINSQMAMANSARGGPTAMGAAARSAAFTGAQTQQSGARDLAAMRAQEMAQARGDYANQAGALRNTDLSAATQQAQLDDAQRARNQQNQQYYEQLGWNTNKQAQDAWMAQEQISNDAYFRNRAADRADDDAEWGRVQSAVGAAGSFIGGIFSDERAKIGGDIIRENPYGSGGGGGNGAAWAQFGSALSKGMKTFGGVKQEKDDGKSAAPVEKPTIAAPASGQTVPVAQLHYDPVIVRQDPYGSSPVGPQVNAYMPSQQTPDVISSDERTKNVGGAMQAFSKYGASMGGASISDERTKQAYAPDGGVMLLYAPEGQELRQSADGHGYLEDFSRQTYQPPTELGGSSSPHADVISAPGAGERSKGGKKKERELTPDEMMKLADRYLSEERSTHNARMAQGPAVGSARGSEQIYVVAPSGSEDPMASANRSQEGSAYSYKPGFAEASGQAPGEMNYGPMAQNMAADPVAATAVRQDPNSGLMTLDRDKWQKLQGAGIASLQRQIDQMRGGNAYYPWSAF